MLSSTTAFAQDLGNDEVSLKNGGSIRGTVVSVEPGNKVVILEFGAKEPRTLTWAEVADVQKGKFAKPEPGPQGPGFATPEPKEDEEDEEQPTKKKKGRKAAGRGVVQLHVESDEPVSVYQEVASGVVASGGYVMTVGVGRFLCASPCDQQVDGSSGQAFVVGGDGIPTSSPFTLSDQEGDTTLNVDPGSNAAKSGGYIMLSVAGAAVAGGIVLLIFGTSQPVDNGNPFSDATETDPAMVGGGIAALVGGVGLAVGGIVMMATSGTDVEVVPGRRPSTDGASFEIDKRTTARTPRYWLGEF